MIVTLFLISTNVYNSVDAPEERGFSYIEMWKLGMQVPIIVAIIEYSVILGLNKFLDKYDDLYFNNVDKITQIISAAYFIIFNFLYWIILSQ